MFSVMPRIRRDLLWVRADEYAADPRPDKLDLIVGVYRDDAGRSPIMRAARTAEGRLLELETTKQYVAPYGNAVFNAALTDLVLGDRSLVERATTIQTVAGTGALRLLADFLAVTGPDRTVHLGTPAYVNHPGVLNAARLRIAEYPLVRDGGLDAEAVLAAANAAQAGDVLLLQGSCHNPTGLTMPIAVWDELATVLASRGVVPFVDHAYFGLGDGLEEDLVGMRRLLRAVPTAVVSVSCSKIWGLYRERTGCAIVLTSTVEDTAYTRDLLESIARATYSQPPAHGAAIVEQILTDPELRADWLSELTAMRERLNTNRAALVSQITAGSPAGETSAMRRVAEQRGMFLTLPLGSHQMDQLSVRHAIYGTRSGRINLAGIPSHRLTEVATAIGDVARGR